MKPDVLDYRYRMQMILYSVLAAAVCGFGLVYSRLIVAFTRAIDLVFQGLGL